MRLDLHTHTTCSDGTLTPGELIAAANAGGLDVVAVTDHDTAAGVEAARAAAAAAGGPQVVAGAELTCSLDGAEVHLLGYGIAPAHPAIAAFAVRGAALRRERLAAMIERLNRLGIRIHVEDVEVPADCAAVGRPHLARALVKRGTVVNFQDAFTRFLADGGPAWVPSRGPGLEEGIAAVHAAGGLSVWAHPALDDARRFAAARALGLDGVETIRPRVEPASSLALEQAAREAGLCFSGGSDWHGAPPAL
ncbi:MAG: PHP domain-containing protein, partial [Gemmatimonadales bacterium]